MFREYILDVAECYGSSGVSLPGIKVFFLLPFKSSYNVIYIAPGIFARKSQFRNKYIRKRANFTCIKLEEKLGLRGIPTSLIEHLNLISESYWMKTLCQNYDISIHV